jgi:hypothetical protein
MPRADRYGAAAGALGIAGNVLGVLFLADVPGAYRAGALEAWAAGTAAHPAESVASAVAFTVGLLALGGWAAALGRRVRRPLARAGAASMAAGAFLNAAGTLTPAVLALHVAPACAGEACLPVARALLGLTLSLDAAFNLLFGAGLVAFAASFARAERRPALGALGLAAGLATLPVALQITSDAAARWLAVAGPLWLAFVLATSFLLWRGRPRRAGRADAGGELAPTAGGA